MPIIMQTYGTFRVLFLREKGAIVIKRLRTYGKLKSD